MKTMASEIYFSFIFHILKIKICSSEINFEHTVQFNLISHSLNYIKYDEIICERNMRYNKKVGAAHKLRVNLK